MTILDQIFAHKREEVARQAAAVPLPVVRGQAAQSRPPRDFVAALHGRPRPALIAEIKRASPSRGLLAPNFDHMRLASIYAANGAACISVLTDERYFGGRLDHLAAVAESVPLPVLRKDFICDPYQVYQARTAGADAVLLIAASLPGALLAELQDLAHALGMAALVEVHTAEELEAALLIEPRLLGINNRNLRDFSVNLDTAHSLRAQVPDGICVVAESGIHTPADVERLALAGIDAILVGEALVTAPDVPAAVRALAGTWEESLVRRGSG